MYIAEIEEIQHIKKDRDRKIQVYIKKIEKKEEKSFV